LYETIQWATQFHFMATTSEKYADLKRDDEGPENEFLQDVLEL